MNFLMLKKPSAFLPLTMALAALILVVVHAALYGVVHEADEGAAAHVFQLLIVAQAPFILFFMVRWLPRYPRQALPVLALQAGVLMAAFASVYFLT